MDESEKKELEQESSEVKRYKSVKTKSYVNRNFNDPNSLDFNSMNREQLMVEASRLQNHVTQLKNLLDKSNKTPIDSTEDKDNKKKKKYKERPFNFDTYNKRHVFLKFAYLGW